MPLSFTTHVHLEESARFELISILNTALATAVDLTSQIKQAHWNIKGPQFVARHELFDRQAVGLRETADKLAERAATLGGYAKGTVRNASTASILPEYDLDAVTGRQHLLALIERYALYTRFLRESAEKTGNDLATQDLFVESLRQAELDMWFLESHVNV